MPRLFQTTYNTETRLSPSDKGNLCEQTDNRAETLLTHALNHTACGEQMMKSDDEAMAHLTHFVLQSENCFHQLS